MIFHNIFSPAKTLVGTVHLSLSESPIKIFECSLLKTYCDGKLQQMNSFLNFFSVGSRPPFSIQFQLGSIIVRRMRAAMYWIEITENWIAGNFILKKKKYFGLIFKTFVLLLLPQKLLELAEIDSLVVMLCNTQQCWCFPTFCSQI